MMKSFIDLIIFEHVLFTEKAKKLKVLPFKITENRK